MNSNRGTVVRKNFVFPFSDEAIEINTYKNADGSFRSAESIWSTLQNGVDAITSAVKQMITIEQQYSYTLRLTSVGNGQVYRAPLMNGKPDFTSEESCYTLSSLEFKKVRGMIIDSTTELLESFENYYRLFDGENVEQWRSENLNDLLRFSNNAKIRGLEDLLGLYMAVNGQSYFDLVFHIIMTGAYTFSSLFSSTSLYRQCYKHLYGKAMLSNAHRRAMTHGDLGTGKGEIRTSDGLIIVHLRQLRIRNVRTMKRETDAVFERITPIEDENQVLIPPVAGTSGQNRAPLDPEIEFNEKFPSSILLYPGAIQLSDFQDRFVTIVDSCGLSSEISALSPMKLRSLGKLCEMLSNEHFQPLWDIVQPYIKKDVASSVVKRVASIDMYEESSALPSIEKIFAYLLAVTSSDVYEGNESYVDRFLAAQLPEELIAEKIEAILSLIR